MFKPLQRCLIRALLALGAVAHVSVGLSAWADDPPTQLHQQLHKMDYTPAKTGLQMLGQPLVRVKINRTEDAIFLIDTGSASSIISTNLAKRLGLRLQPAVDDNGKAVHYNGDVKQATMTQVSLFQTDNITADNALFLVQDAKLINLFHNPSPEGNCDGIIGANMLEHSAIYLDGPQHKFGFCLPGAVSLHQLSQIGMPSPYVLPLTTNTSANQWFVRAELTNGNSSSSEDLLLDTGSNGTIVSARLGQEVHLKQTGDGIQKDSLGSAAVSTGQADALRLGNLTLRNPLIVMRPMFGGGPPLLGMDILSNYRILMDFPAKKMYLQPNASAVPAIIIGPAPAPAVPPAK